MPSSRAPLCCGQRKMRSHLGQEVEPSFSNRRKVARPAERRGATPMLHGLPLGLSQETEGNIHFSESTGIWGFSATSHREKAPEKTARLLLSSDSQRGP